MFIARQPIFDRYGSIFGYELLFRKCNTSTRFEGVSSSEATRIVLTGLFESGVASIVDNNYAFVNFDEVFIHSSALELIEPSKLVVEILEDVFIEDNLIKRIDELREKGYKVALDDFFESYVDYPLTALADIIKYDIRATPLEDLTFDLRMCIDQNKVALAEKVETQEEFLRARDMGFSLFQGYFFSKPLVIGKTSKSFTSKIQYGLLLQELRKEEPSYQVLANIIDKNITMVYKLMRVINGRVGEGDTVDSIKRALTYMGLRELEIWVNITMLHSLGRDKPKELLKLSVQRSKFMEQIAEHSNYFSSKRYEAYMLGLFSTIDAILDQTMEYALKDVSIPSSVCECLALKKGELFPLYELTLSYENGSWDKVSNLAQALGLEDNLITDYYLKSIDYSNKICQEICEC